MTVNWPLYAEVIQEIEKAGAGAVLDRIRRLIPEGGDEEKRLDVMFVYHYRHEPFPQEDHKLIEMYITYIDKSFGEFGEKE